MQTKTITNMKHEWSDCCKARLHVSDQACVSQKTRKLLGPEDFSGLFSDEFFGSRKAFLNAPENTPDSHPSFRVVFSGLQRELDSDLLRT